MPKLQEIRNAFKGIGLAGAYDIRWLDYKHIHIGLSNEQDMNRIWLKQVWFISNQKLRVFKWTKDFQPEKESSLVPVWISFPNLRAHLYEKSAVLVIAKTVGRPLFVDEATDNGTRPSLARVCIEYDCLKPPLDQVWIVMRDRRTGEITGGFMQKVDFERMPDYCTHCCHVGHSVSTCIVMGNKRVMQGPERAKPSDEKNKINTEEIGKDKQPVERRERLVRTENGNESIDINVKKQGMEWREVMKAGKSGTKDDGGVEIAAQDKEKGPVQVPNSFSVIENLQENECGKQDKTELRNNAYA